MKVCEICGARFRGNPERCPLDGGALVPVPDPLIGRTLSGRYVIEERIGAGGMSTVYRAKHEVVGRDVAVKFLSPELAFEPANRTRFLREARAANRINHEHIIDITDFGETEDALVYLVMEYLDGIPLSQAIADGPMAVERALRITRQVGKALARAHELGVIHRDVKPDNIYLLHGYEGDFAKLLDFGLAQMKGELRVTATGTVFGTPEYIAPEQARGANLGPTADLYSFGCVLFEMLTGRLPFTGSTPDLILKHLREPPRPPSHHVANLSPEIDALVLSLLEKRPDDRLSSAHELVEIVTRMLGEMRPSVTPTTAALRPELAEPAAEAPSAPRLSSHDLVVRWQDRVEVFRHLVDRAHPNGDVPAWLPDAIEALAGRVRAAVSLVAELSERITRVTSQQDESRDVRLRIGHALDTLAADHARLGRELLEAESALAEARTRGLQVEEPLIAAWRRVPSFDPARLEEALSAIAEAGALAQIRVESAQRVESLEASIRRLRAEADDLAFQASQLKGRLGSAAAVDEADRVQLSEATEALDAQVQDVLDGIAREAEPIVRHFMAFPQLRDVVRGAH
ncbi:MAG: protein kinase [Myxococcales bacterium]|nr:protein kinase [Myxococcales bacterium]